MSELSLGLNFGPEFGHAKIRSAVAADGALYQIKPRCIGSGPSFRQDGADWVLVGTASTGWGATWESAAALASLHNSHRIAAQHSPAVSPDTEACASELDGRVAKLQERAAQVRRGGDLEQAVSLTFAARQLFEAAAAIRARGQR